MVRGPEVGRSNHLAPTNKYNKKRHLYSVSFFVHTQIHTKNWLVFKY